jgi:hypothetical protein
VVGKDEVDENAETSPDQVLNLYDGIHYCPLPYLALVGRTILREPCEQSSVGLVGREVNLVLGLVSAECFMITPEGNNQ